MPALLDQWLDRFRRARDYRRQVYVFFAKDDLATADSGNVQEVINEASHLLDLPVNHVKVPLYLWVLQFQHPQQLNGIADRREGIAQFMRKRRQELILAAVRLAQRFFNAMLLGDVGVAAEPAHYTSLLIADGNCTG